METAYSFEIRKNSDEIHIFQGTYNVAKVTYRSSLTSICEKKVTRRSDLIEDAQCLNESEARYKAAFLGRAVCGTCVSHLYKKEN